MAVEDEFEVHPDRFVKKFKEAFKEEGVRAVAEMFGILTELAGRDRIREEASGNGWGLNG